MRNKKWEIDHPQKVNNKECRVVKKDDTVKPFSDLKCPYIRGVCSFHRFLMFLFFILSHGSRYVLWSEYESLLQGHIANMWEPAVSSILEGGRSLRSREVGNYGCHHEGILKVTPASWSLLAGHHGVGSALYSCHHVVLHRLRIDGTEYFETKTPNKFLPNLCQAFCHIITKSKPADLKLWVVTPLANLQKYIHYDS